MLEDGDESTATGDLEQVLLARTARFGGHRVLLWEIRDWFNGSRVACFSTAADLSD